MIKIIQPCKIIKHWQNGGKIVSYLHSEVKLMREIQNGVFGAPTLYCYQKERDTLPLLIWMLAKEAHWYDFAIIIFSVRKEKH